MTQKRKLLSPYTKVKEGEPFIPICTLVSQTSEREREGQQRGSRDEKAFPVVSFRYLRRRTKKRALLMIALAWTGASAWMIPVLGWHHFVSRGVRTVPGRVV